MPGVLCQAGTWTKVQKPLGDWQQDAVPSPSLEWALLLVLGTRAAAGKGSSISVHGQFPICTSLEQ